jgi:hypothetical protein
LFMAVMLPCYADVFLFRFSPFIAPSCELDISRQINAWLNPTLPHPCMPSHVVYEIDRFSSS